MRAPKESAYENSSREGIFKLLWSPGIDSKEWIPSAYVAWRACTTTLFLLGFCSPQDCPKISTLNGGQHSKKGGGRNKAPGLTYRATPGSIEVSIKDIMGGQDRGAYQ